MSVATQSPLLEAVPTGVHKSSGILYFDGRDALGCDVLDLSSAELEHQLMAFGFWKAGEMATQPLKADYNPYTGDDAEEFDRYMPNGQQNGVLISEDQTTFAEPEFSHGTHHLRLRTLLESGDIVETRLIPARIPRPKYMDEFLEQDDQPTGCPDEDAANAAYDATLTRLLQPSDEAAHPSYPRAGLWRKSAREPNVSRLWRLHRTWVGEVQARVGSQPVTLDNTAQVLQITRRAWHIVESHLDWSLAATVWLGRAVKALTVASFIAGGAWLGLDIWFAIALTLASLATSIVTSRFFCRPVLCSVAAMFAACLAARWLNQPPLISVGLVLCFGIAKFLVDFGYLIVLVQEGGTLTRALPWPRRIAAADLATAYPDPQFPNRS